MAAVGNNDIDASHISSSHRSLKASNQRTVSYALTCTKFSSFNFLLTFTMLHFAAFCGRHARSVTTQFERTVLSNSPVMRTADLGLLFWPVETFSILRTASMPSITLPNTTCLESKKSHGWHVMKNCGTEVVDQYTLRDGFCTSAYLAAISIRARIGLQWTGKKSAESQSFHTRGWRTMLNNPAPVCFSLKFSSSNLSP
jgi:hypothetical protein